ncbi:hypothetical protein DL96DRAFT_1706675 [Flagelloscypha sp. PMI_526]|nr:hypothetical protein DL96DRAFT_1706675 [Flagelloscypha sp. PMI_526]
MFSSSPSTSSTTVITESDKGHPSVRFVESCVLIPSPPPPTPSASLPGGLEVNLTEKHIRIPTWGRRAASESTGVFDETEPEKEGVRIVLPRFRRSHSTSSKRLASPTTPPALPSILRSPSLTPPLVPKRLRRPSLPVPLHAETIPLRACCHECYSITEESINDPEWVEKFSKSAQHPHLHPGQDGVFELKVDEVDKIRRSRPPSPPPPSIGASSLTIDAEKSLRCITRSSPIYEHDEDESQLFPLPSPCRFTPSPTHTPSTTPPPCEDDSNDTLQNSKSRFLHGYRSIPGRRSPLSSEIALDSPPIEEPADVLSAQPSLVRKVESPVPRSHVMPITLGLPQGEHEPGEDPDKIPDAFLSSYISNKTQSPPALPETPSKLFSPFSRRRSSSTISKSRSQEREPSPEKHRVEASPKQRRQGSSIGFSDMLRGVTSVKSVGTPSM